MSTPPQDAGNGRLTVLVVEDAEDARDLYAMILEDAGYRPRCTDTVASALEALRSERIDAILTDFNLPDGDGLTMLDAAEKEGSITEAIPVVLCTAWPMGGRGALRQVAKLLVKPVDPAALVRAIREAIAAVRERQAS